MKQQFFNFVLLAVNNFSAFYFPGAATSKPDTAAKKIFNFDGYLSQCPDQARPFMREFIGTQTFVNFIESAHLTVAHKDRKSCPRTEVTFFQDCIRYLLGRSYRQLLKKQTQQIAGALDRFLQPSVISVNGCLEAYTEALRKLQRTHSVTVGEPIDHSSIVSTLECRVVPTAVPQTDKSRSPSAAAIRALADQPLGRIKSKHQRVPSQGVQPPVAIIKVLQRSQSPQLRASRSPSRLLCSKPSLCPFSNTGEGSKRSSDTSFISPTAGTVSKASFMMHPPSRQKSFVLSGSPQWDWPLSTETGKERSESALSATDKQLAFTISQLQHRSHVSNISNRTTTDSVSGGKIPQGEKDEPRKSRNSGEHARKPTQTAETIFEVSREQLQFRSSARGKVAPTKSKATGGKSCGRTKKKPQRTECRKRPINRPPIQQLVRDLPKPEQFRFQPQATLKTRNKEKEGKEALHYSFSGERSACPVGTFYNKLSSKIMCNKGDADYEPDLC